MYLNCGCSKSVKSLAAPSTAGTAVPSAKAFSRLLLAKWLIILKPNRSAMARPKKVAKMVLPILYSGAWLAWKVCGPIQLPAP